MSSSPALEEIIAAALNEQGYLLQHKVASMLEKQSNDRMPRHKWKKEVSELPVSLPNVDETRIDFVLSHGSDRPPVRRAVLECKRAAREYKIWLFFGEEPRTMGPSARYYYIEEANLSRGWDGNGDPEMMHRVVSRGASAECQVFDYYMESRLNPPKREKSSSATTAIEGAFQQVTLGQAGLALKLRKAHQLNFQLVPVVITTANLMSTHFPADRVTIDDGKILAADLRSEPRKWLAVNFRMNEVMCQHSGVSINRTADLASDLAARQVRTIFVAQAAHLDQFLEWLETVFKS